MNKIIRHEFSNTYNNEQPMQAEYPDVDKTKPIGKMTREELDSLIQRLYREREAENLLAEMQNLSEVDKSKSISEMTQRELDKFIQRLGRERDAQDLMKNLNSNAGVEMFGPERATLDTTTPINQLYHHGILGMKWGVRRTPAQLGHLTKKDNKWVKKNTEKITEKARKKSSKELMKYANELIQDQKAVNKSGKLSADTINSYNKKMASLMNEQVSNLTSPSGKVVRFVAKRGEVGVFMALADQGYNMNQLKNGIYESGKVAYRKTVVDKV